MWSGIYTVLYQGFYLRKICSIRTVHSGVNDRKMFSVKKTDLWLSWEMMFSEVCWRKIEPAWTSLRFFNCAWFQVNSVLWKGPNGGLWRLMDSYYHLLSFIWANFPSARPSPPNRPFRLQHSLGAKEDLLSFQLLYSSTKHDSLTALTSIRLFIRGTWI